jgi:hypothetical protein
MFHLVSQKWFFGDISEAEADALLSKKKRGVRSSPSLSLIHIKHTYYPLTDIIR